MKYLLVSIICLAICACGDVDVNNESDEIIQAPEAPAISIGSVPLISDGDIDVDSDKINNNGAFRIYVSAFAIQKPIDLVLQKFGNQLEEVSMTIFLYGTRSVIFFLRDEEIQPESAYLIRGHVSNSEGIEVPLAIRFFTKIKEVEDL